jgi:glutathione S-transferase
MPVRYVSVEEAIVAKGLRMVVVGNVPSPWGEAAKGILHIKAIDWAAVRLVYDSEPLKQWAGERSGPIAIHESERPRAGWAEILLLAERLASTPSLVPADAAERATMFGLAHEICGEGGLGWARRLQLVHAGLQKSGGFTERAAQYLGRKYGYTPEIGAAAGSRVTALLRMLAARLHASGGRYYLGDRLTAVDIYSATFMALFRPLPPEQCAMAADSRAAFETLDPHTAAALDPTLLQHRDMIYAKHLELPLSL